MRKLFLLFLLLPSAIWAATNVFITATRAVSHSSASVEFTWSGTQPNYLRTRTSPANGSCLAGTGGVVSDPIGNTGSLSDRDWFPWEGNNGPANRGRAFFGGMLAKTTYQLCPEVSADGTTWSTGAGATITTASLPAQHPSLPIRPTDVTTTYPDPSGSFNQVTGSTCSTVVANMNTAVSNLMTSGQTVILPSPCTGLMLQFNQIWPDVITFNAAGVNAANNTISNWVYPGDHTCGTANHVTCLTEGQQVKFLNLSYYGTDLPTGMRDLNSEHGHGVLPYIFTVHLVDSTHFQITYDPVNGQSVPYSKCASCVWKMLDQGSGTNMGFVQWPRQTNWLILKQSTAESAFPPAATRVGLQWQNKMSIQHLLQIFDHSELGSAGFAGEPGVGKLWIEGVYADFPDDGERSPRPVTYASPYGHPEKLVSFGQDSGPIILDRSVFHGPDTFHRISSPFGLDGAGIALINSWVDRMYAWYPSSTWEGILPSATGTGITNTTGVKTFTIGPGEIHGGPFNYVQATTMTVTLSGTPTNTSGPTKQAVYVDNTGAIKVMYPVGMTCSTTIGTCVSGSTTYDANVSLTSSILQQESVGGQSRPAVMPIAFFDVLGNGNLNFLGAALVGNQGASSCDWQGCEGSDTMIAGRGPGPLKLENNYFNWNGNLFNVDDCLNGSPAYTCALIVGDYTIRRNYYDHPLSIVRSQPGWNGNMQLHRQGVEWKHGNRAWVIGNVFNGPNGCDNQNPTGTAVLSKPIVGTGNNDVNTEFNTVRHSCGFSGAGNYVNTGNILSDVQKRIRFANNLVYDNDGWHNSSYVGPSTYHGSSGWFFQMNGPFEDLIIDHNTFALHDGLKPSWFTVYSAGEGSQLTNNIWYYAANPGGSAATWDANTTHTGTVAAACSALSDKALLDCVWPDNVTSKNVIIPGANSNNIWATTCDNQVSDHQFCIQRQTMNASAQITFASTCTAFGGTVSGGNCTGGAASSNTVMNYASGLAAAVTSLKWANATKYVPEDAFTDYGLRYDSPVISGSFATTDGATVGADMVALARAQGMVQLQGATAVGTTTATISFFAPDAQSCPVDFILTAGDPTVITGFTRVSDSGTNTGLRAVSLTGLTSGASYSYRVNCAVQQPMGIFKTR